MRKVIFDVDGDADNLLTVSAALCDPSLDVLGITTVHGMDSAADAAEHIRALLDGMSVSRPVIEGAGAPLMRERMVPAGDDCGSTGVEAADWMAGRLLESAEPVTVCLLGAATNLILLYRNRPEAFARIERVLFMGGSFAFGTINASACHKVYCDAEAMQLLMHTGVPFYMMPIDETSDIPHGIEIQSLMQKLPGSLWQHMARLCPPPVRANRYLHTPYAVEVLREPDAFSFRKVKCEVELHGTLTYGMTVAYLNDFDGVIDWPDGHRGRRDVGDEERNVWYVQPFDRKTVLERILHRVETLEWKGGTCEHA